MIAIVIASRDVLLETGIVDVSIKSPRRYTACGC